MRRTLLTITAVAALCSTGVSAQEDDTPVDALPPAPSELLQIGLSTDRVMLTAGYTGFDLTIFGALENLDPTLSRLGRYDVVVVLEGPAREVIVRKKTRVLGMWINTDSDTFLNVPMSYSMTSTRQVQDITTRRIYQQLSLGPANLHLEPADPEESPPRLQEFEQALRDTKRRTNLFISNPGGVEFLSQSLFRASLKLAPNVPVGTHKARAFLFRNGEFIKESSAQLAIQKSGFEQWIFRSAQTNGFLYGLASVALAMGIGWLGRIVFRRD